MDQEVGRLPGAPRPQAGPWVEGMGRDPERARGQGPDCRIPTESCTWGRASQAQPRGMGVLLVGAGGSWCRHWGGVGPPTSQHHSLCGGGRVCRAPHTPPTPQSLGCALREGTAFLSLSRQHCLPPSEAAFGRDWAAVPTSGHGDPGPCERLPSPKAWSF